MSSVSASPKQRARQPIALPRLRETIAIGAVSAAVGYLLHHLPPLSDHLLTTVAIVLLVAAGSALALGAAAARRHAYALPNVIVPRTGAVVTRAPTAEDLDFCAALHGDALGHGFFAALGPRFLRTYYAAFRDSPHAAALTATLDGEPVGYLVGTVRARAHARWVFRHRGALLGLQAAAGLALHPGVALRFLRTRLRRYADAWRRHRQGPGTPTDDSGADVAVLSHIAILRGARGLGAGRLLVREFEAEARGAGAMRAFLTTLEGPDGAGDFYASLGWRRSATRPTPDGRLMEEWSRDLSDDRA